MKSEIFSAYISDNLLSELDVIFPGQPENSGHMVVLFSPSVSFKTIYKISGNLGKFDFS